MRLLAIAVLMSGTVLSTQLAALDYFVGVDGVRSKVEIGNVSYNPVLLRARLGAFFAPGIGLEVNLANTQEADEEVGLEASLESHYAAMLRLQSPLDGHLSVYVNLGYGATELLIDGIETGSSLIEELESHFASIGFQKQFNAYPRISYFGEYNRIYSDDNIKISAFSFGYQFNF